MRNRADWANREQREHMDALDRIPADQRCWCGWWEAGWCPNCPRCTTLANRLPQRCPDCGALPRTVNDTAMTHRARCPRNTP